MNDPQNVVSLGEPVDTSRRSSDAYLCATELYRVGRGRFNGFPFPYLFQGGNGPCPLLAICNVLLLRGLLTVSDTAQDVSLGVLVEKLMNFLMDKGDNAVNDGKDLLPNAVEILPSLSTGLDVDIRFTSVTGFESSPELSLFDLFGIKVYHGWIVSEDDMESYPYLSSVTFNSAMVKISEYEHVKQAVLSASSDPESVLEGKKELMQEGEAISHWFEQTSHQLTTDGIIQLHAALSDNELGILFRNNHFSVIHKHNQNLFLLVTDIGYRNTSVMWEGLDQIDGDTMHYDSEFKLVKNDAFVENGNTQDADRELAMRLQYGPNYGANSAAAAPVLAVPRSNVQVVVPPSSSRKSRKEKKCTIM